MRPRKELILAERRTLPCLDNTGRQGHTDVYIMHAPTLNLILILHSLRTVTENENERGWRIDEGERNIRVNFSICDKVLCVYVFTRVYA